MPCFRPGRGGPTRFRLALLGAQSSQAWALLPCSAPGPVLIGLRPVALLCFRPSLAGPARVCPAWHRAHGRLVYGHQPCCPQAQACMACTFGLRAACYWLIAAPQVRLRARPPPHAQGKGEGLRSFPASYVMGGLHAPIPGWVAGNITGLVWQTGRARSACQTAERWAARDVCRLRL